MIIFLDARIYIAIFLTTLVLISIRYRLYTPWSVGNALEGGVDDGDGGEAMLKKFRVYFDGVGPRP